MPIWYRGNITYQQPIDDATVGTRNEEFIKQKNTVETHLVDAISYTDAEAKLNEIGATINSTYEVGNIVPMKLADVLLHDDGDTWFKVKALFILDDEKTGKQKKTPSVMLVNAETPKEAYERVEVSLKSSLDPFEITDINTTKIVQIHPHDAD